MAENEVRSARCRRRGRLVMVAFALAPWSVPALAQQAPPGGNAVAPSGTKAQPGYVVLRVGAGTSDNILRVPANGEHGSYEAPGLAFGLSSDATRLTATLDGDLEHRRYNVPGIASELYGTMNASVQVHAIPDRFSWLIGDGYGQARLDPFLIDTPINREHFNVATTGPRLQIPLGGRTQLLLDGTLSKRTFQASKALDSDATTPEIGLSRALSVRSEFNFTVSRRHTKYAALPLGDNDIQNVYVSYKSRLATGSALVALGTSRLDLSATSDSTPYASFRWRRDVGARSSIDLSASNQFIDAVQNFIRAGIFNPDLQQLSFLLSASVYRHSDAGVTYSMQFPRTSIQIDGSSARDKYAGDQTLDNDFRRIGLELRYTISPQVSAALTGYYVDRQFVQSGQHDKDKLLDLSLTKRLGDRFSLQVDYQRARVDYQRVDLASIGGQSFDENTVRVSFLWDAVRGQARTDRTL